MNTGLHSISSLVKQCGSKSNTTEIAKRLKAGGIRPVTQYFTGRKTICLYGDDALTYLQEYQQRLDRVRASKKEIAVQANQQAAASNIKVDMIESDVIDKLTGDVAAIKANVEKIMAVTTKLLEDLGGLAAVASADADEAPRALHG